MMRLERCCSCSVMESDCVGKGRLGGTEGTNSQYLSADYELLRTFSTSGVKDVSI